MTIIPGFNEIKIIKIDDSLNYLSWVWLQTKANGEGMGFAIFRNQLLIGIRNGFD